MGKKKDKKSKKISVKKERYAKFKKEKPNLDISMPDLEPDQQKQKQVDEKKIERFLRFSRNPITKTVVKRKMESKR